MIRNMRSGEQSPSALGWLSPIIPAALIVALLLLVATASAQYLYLDTNGNGVSDGCDRISESGPTTIDIWLDTSRNRDGSPATCSFGAGTLRMNHYEVVLQAVGGTLTWGPMTNRMDGFSSRYTRSAGDTTGTVFYHNGWGGSTIVAPGLYRVATLTVSVASGNPRMNVIDRHPSNGTGVTGFGTECPGSGQYDHSARRGRNWTDVAGLSRPILAPPLMLVPGIVVPTDGATVAFTIPVTEASEGAIQSLAADLSGLPPGSGATFVVNPSLTSGTFTWTPTASDSGDYFVNFTSSNCLLSDARTTVIHVIGTPTAVEAGESAPHFRLGQNKPNPFNPSTAIDYSLPRLSATRLVVFDARGAFVRELVNSQLSAGPHTAGWDGTDASGNPVASGVYWYRLEADGLRLTKTMVLLR
jgi:flagellar hook capping protein FlgD